MVRTSALFLLSLLAACKPPASQDYAARTQTSPERTAPAAPVDSPDVEGATWAPSPSSGRLLYGKPGEAPFFSLACENGNLVYTRYVAADRGAKAVLALIGNGHVERLWIDAEQDGPDEDSAFLWRGQIVASDPRLDVLTGPRRVEATVPGAGSLILNASSAPGEFITRCAGLLPQPQDPPGDPA